MSRGIALPFHDLGAEMEVGGQHHAPAVLPPGKTRYPLDRRLFAVAEFSSIYFFFF